MQTSFFTSLTCSALVYYILVHGYVAR